MGCLVAKCSLTNVALNEGDTAYINIITPSLRKRSWHNDSLSLTNYKTGSKKSFEYKVPYPKSRFNSFELYSPVGVVLKGKYTGWSSFELDLNDQMTLNNFKMLASHLEFDISSRHRTIFDAKEFNRLFEKGEYAEAWALVDETLRFQEAENLFISDKSDLIQLQYNVICNDAIEHILQLDVQNEIFIDHNRWQCEKSLSLQQYYDYIIEYVDNFKHSRVEVGLDKPENFRWLKIEISRAIFGDGFSGIDCVPLINSRHPFEEYILDASIESANDLNELYDALRRLVFANYINFAYTYYGVQCIPLSNVNFEEYDNERTSKFNKLQRKVIDLHETRFNEHCLFERPTTCAVIKDNEDVILAQYFITNEHIEDFYEHLKSIGITYFIKPSIRCIDVDNLIVYDSTQERVYFENDENFLERHKVIF